MGGKRAACVCDVPSVAGAARSVSKVWTWKVRSSRPRRSHESVYARPTHVPTDVHTVTFRPLHALTAGTAGALDGAADGARAAPDGCAPVVAEPPVAHAVRVVKVPQPAEDAQEPRRPPHDGGRRGRRAADAHGSTAHALKTTQNSVKRHFGLKFSSPAAR